MLATLSTDLALALDPVQIARRAGFEPDPWQSDLLRDPAREIMLLCSRQAGKSTVTSIAALAEALFNPPALVLILAPALRQAQEVFRKVRDAYDAVHEHAPGLALPVEDSALRLEFSNGSRIICLPGKAMTVRGFSGARLIIVDEAAWVEDALYQSIRPMLAVSQGRIMLLSTPFGKRGFFFKEWTEGGKRWKRVKIDAYQCPRISREWLDEERAAIGDWWFDQEYLCMFKEKLDSVFAYDDIQAALVDDVEPLFEAGA